MESLLDCSKTKEPDVNGGFVHCGNNKGIALVTSLLFTLLCLGMILTVLYFVTQGTRVSNIQKRYQTALEASFGSADFIVREVIPKTIMGVNLSSLGNYSGFVSYQATDVCFNDKLTKPTANWSSGCSSTLDSKSLPDMKFTLSGAQGQNAFDVYAKIVDTKPGNSSTSGIELEGIGVVESNSGVLTPPHFPYTYRIELQGERQANPDERANLSGFYEY